MRLRGRITFTITTPHRQRGAIIHEVVSLWFASCSLSNHDDSSFGSDHMHAARWEILACVWLIMSREMWPLYGNGGPSRDWRLKSKRWGCVCVCVHVSMTCPFNRRGSREVAVGEPGVPGEQGLGKSHSHFHQTTWRAAWQLAAANAHSPTPHILVYMQRDCKTLWMCGVWPARREKKKEKINKQLNSERITQVPQHKRRHAL